MLIPLCQAGNGPATLRPFINAGNLQGLLPGSGAPDLLQGLPALESLRAYGFEGIQGVAEHLVPVCHRVGLTTAASGRILQPAEIHDQALRWRDAGHACATLHVGTGMEDDAEADRLCAAVISAADRSGLPLFVETHRATITQDQWRTVHLVRRHPDLRFNGDFSHWYTGQEMPYGDFEERLDFLMPVFERTRFFHGRIGNSGCIQVALQDPSAPVAVQHFRAMWTRCLQAFRAQACPGAWIAFAPELLDPVYHYARCRPTVDGGWSEEGDRWQDALELIRIITECWNEAGAANASISDSVAI